MARSVLVRVTEDDIAKGQRYDCRDCPVALAIRRATGLCGMVIVRFAVLLSPGAGVPFERVALPIEASAFILGFDHGRPGDPFFFTLELPDGL